VQVNYTVAKEVMFREHTYLSGANSSMPMHFASVAQAASRLTRFGERPVVDIGSNDGTLLAEFKKLGATTLGVEPCVDAAARANERGINTWNEFFDLSCATRIRSTHGAASVVSAANVFYHVEDLHGIVEGVRQLLDDDGIFVIQGTYLPTMLARNEFDIIYHEHLLYYRMGNLSELLQIHGLELFDVEFAEVHGGSFIAYACPAGRRVRTARLSDVLASEVASGLNTIHPYLEFATRIAGLRESVRSFLQNLKSQGATIGAFGAPAKGTVMMNYCGLDSRQISFAVEVNEEKVGTFIPGTDVPVLHERDAAEPDYYFLLSWNFLEVFKTHHAFVSGARRFIVPIPSPRIEAKYSFRGLD
jgi:SAM-dependent methyltransferase